MQDKPIQALLCDFTEFGVKFKFRYWIENFVETRISEDRLNTAIYKILTSKGIAVPSLQLLFVSPTKKRNGEFLKKITILGFDIGI